LVIKNSTVDLIKNSECVIMHQSTSVNYCVLYDKPILFINSNCLDINLRVRINFLSEYFEQKPINISLNYFMPINYIHINKDIYKNYKKKHIKIDNTPEKNSWEIFCNYLEEFFLIE
jgi:hypothetical protein